MSGSSLKVVPCGHQPGTYRHPRNQDENAQSPTIGRWRNNVTALSQYYNLYFVAYLDQIYIYQPQYSNQIVPKIKNAVGWLPLPASRSDLTGYINGSKPQGVNHLIVRDLGEDEILLVACDGGDVMAFRTRFIHKTIQDSCFTTTKMVKRLSIEPFFRENVGASAWGLDVHKAARLIAVSSNTHDIVVFAFALSSQDPETESKNDTLPVCDTEVRKPVIEPRKTSHRHSVPCSADWKLPESPSCRFRRREHNYAWHLKCHQTNVPAIAFYNNVVRPADDVVLLSTDIDGKSMLWEVWEQYLFWGSSNGRGWAVACLDPLSARPSKSEIDTYGSSVKSNPGSHGGAADNTDCIMAVKDNSQWHPAYPEPLASQQEAADVDPEDALVEAIEAHPELDPLSMTIDEQFAEDLQAQFVAQVDENLQPYEEVQDLNMHQDGDDDEVSQDEDVPDQDNLDEGIPNEEDSQGSASMGSDVTATETDSDQSMDETLTVEDYTIHSPKYLKKASPSPHVENVNLKRDSPCNFLSTTETDIFFHDGQYKESPQDTPSANRLMCRRPLSQKFPDEYTLMERLNMICQVPELGLVVVGNQVGRVGLLTMTYWAEKDTYGFKVEAILPFRSEEMQGKRPKFDSLLGIAISPVQGQYQRHYSPSDSDDERPKMDRKFRLLMYYYDHTVLAYEISRPSTFDSVVIS